MMLSRSLFLLLLSWATLTVLIHGIVPPKTPVISGFEPAAIGTNRELVCDASQPDAGTITYKWYKFSKGTIAGECTNCENWEKNGPIGTSQKYIFNPLSAQTVSGKYKCRATNSAGTKDSEWGDLYVYTRCSLYTVSVTPAKSVVGSKFTLKCLIPNSSGFSVEWTKQKDSASPIRGEAVANSKGCHDPSVTRYSWSSCIPPSLSSKTNTFNLQVTNAQTSDSAYWICKDINLSCTSDPVKIVIQAPPGTPQITGFPTGPVASGTQVNLNCSALPPGDTYDWYKDGTKLTTSISYDFQVKKESAGVYKCAARNTAGSATSSDKTLIVYSKSDSVVVSSGKTSCHAGESDTFTCTATGGYPPPSLKIYIKRSGGTPVKVTQSQDRVMAKKDNQAEFYCEAKVAGYPSFNMDSPKKTYNVSFPNTNVSFINNPTAAVQVGQVKKFTCETDESNQVTSMKWYQSGGGALQDITTGITSSERNGVYGGKIRISEWSVTATKVMNGGIVRCAANYLRTGHGFVTSADTVMSVKWSATELKMVKKPKSPSTAGTNVNIKCETDSSNSGSPGSISWYRNEQQITTGVTPSTRSGTDGSIIYISQLTVTARKEDNQAKYECKIKDQANFKKDVTITVHWSATAVKMIDKPNSPITAGTSVNIKCETDSSNSGSPVTISWYRNGQDITKGVTPSTRSATYGGTIYISQLTVTTSKADNQAKYECMINDQANIKKDVTITVYSKSDTVVVSSGKTSCHAGEKNRFTCKATGGYPTPTLKIYIKGLGGTAVEITQGQDRLMVKEDNKAEFYCEANVANYSSLDMASPKKTNNVTFPNTKVSFLKNPTAAVQVEQLKKFTCETDESNPVTSIKWDQQVGASWEDVTSGITASESNGAYGGKIRISEWSVTATKAMNNRTVRCSSGYPLAGHSFASNADIVMNVTWIATELMMVEKPNSPITAGKVFNVKCETDSSNSGSPGTISWYRNGQQITTGVATSTGTATDRGTIYISQLTVTARKDDNQAKYECKINDQADFKKDVSITVYFPPSGIQLSETNITVGEGELKSITCSTTSSSNPVVSGVSVKKKLGSKVVDTTGTSRVTNGSYYGKNVSIDIKLDHNRKDNGAQYICSFIHGSTTFTKTATVNVQWSVTDLKMVEKPNSPIAADTSVNIKCETDSGNSGSPVTISWSRNGQQITTGVTSSQGSASDGGKIYTSQLTVTARKTDNQAMFECKINEQAIFTKNVTITVHYPPTVKLSSNLKSVKEGENLSLTCEASGGNPTSYTYSWYYNNLKQSETSKVYDIIVIKYTQSGTYKCEAINYSPGGKAKDLTEVDVLYKAKWNPALPELFTVASKTNEPVKFVLHVIANRPPKNVTWFYKNGTKTGESFTALKVNDTTYTLNKTSVTIKDYGNYTVNVINDVGVSSFVFELQQAGPPLPPCCLKMVNKTAVSVYLTFKSNFSGGSDQTFTIEQSPERSRRKRSEWVKAAEKILDPGFEEDVFHKVKGLKSGTTYQFRVKAVNADGSSGYNDPGNGNFLQVTTKAAPNADLDVTRKDNSVAVSWSLERVYSKIQIEYCPVKGGGPCLYHDVESPAKQGSTTIDVNKEQTYKYSLVVFDGDDKVFVSPPQQPPPPPLNYVAIGGGAGAGFLLLLIIIVVIVAVLFIKKRRAEKGNGKLVTNSNTAEGTVNVAFNDPDDIDGGMNPYADSGLNPYTDSDMNPYADSIEMAASSSSTIQVEGAPGATYAVVNKGNKKPLIGGKAKEKDATPSGSQAYADVDFSKKLKKGKGKNKPTPETGEAYNAYDVIDFSKKKKGAAQSISDGSAEQAYDVIDFSKKKNGAAPSKPVGPDGAVYAQVNKKPPVGDEYAQVDFKKKALKNDAVPDTAGDVYAVVNKPTKPDKPPKPGTSDDQAVYADVNGMSEGHVNGMAEDDIYEDVRDDALIKEGYKQPKTAYQVGVDGTIYSEVRIKPPKNPDVIIGKETIEDPYDSVDFTKKAPPLISNPDDPNDSGFIDLI